MHKTRFAVIGTGAAGICAIRYIAKNIPKAQIIAFDINEAIGGTWLYKDETKNPFLGSAPMTSMYKNLRTNLPRQLMQFSDYPISKDYKTFMSSGEFLQYLNSYVKNFDLEKYIKFNHIVTLVKLSGESWRVSYKSLVTSEVFDEDFDYVFVCNGHYSEPSLPNIEGKDLFKGRQIHSHEYRVPEHYKDKKVLVVGSGPSGLDISIEIATVAEKLFLSHHKPSPVESPFPSNYFQRPDVKKFSENSVEFIDGVVEEIDEVLYCTGYAYRCPFLDPSCGIVVEKTHIRPVYRHIVNVEHPTMFFIGLPVLCSPIITVDIQMRYAIAAIKRDFSLPSKDNMLNHIENDRKSKVKIATSTKSIALHVLARNELSYYRGLSEESLVQPVPPVYCQIRLDIAERRKNLYTYRDYHYDIIDDKRYRSYLGERPTDEDEIRESEE